MANTKKLVNIADGQHRKVYFTLVSDGTQETALPIYDSSTFSGTDSLYCKLKKLSFSTSCASTAKIGLYWDATTKVLACTLPTSYAEELNFGDVGLPNQGGTGITGDIVLTTTGLASGDQLMITLEVTPN